MITKIVCILIAGIISMQFVNPVFVISFTLGSIWGLIVEKYF